MNSFDACGKKTKRSGDDADFGAAASLKKKKVTQVVEATCWFLLEGHTKNFIYGSSFLSQRRFLTVELGGEEVDDNMVAPWFWGVRKMEVKIRYEKPQITSLAALFTDCSGLLSCHISGDLSSVTDMSSMFSGCSSLSVVTGLENFNFGQLTNTFCMFSGCSSLVSLNVREADLTKIPSSFMFYGCISLAYTPIRTKYDGTFYCLSLLEKAIKDDCN